MKKAKRFCRCPGCKALTSDPTGFCEQHREIWEAQQRQRDMRRGSARDRGYDSRWSAYSRWYLKQPGHRLCALRLDDGCAIVAQCVDHIDPPENKDDPKFWNPANHQPACIHCNSVKGHRMIVGKHRF